MNFKQYFKDSELFNKLQNDGLQEDQIFEGLFGRTGYLNNEVQEEYRKYLRLVLTERLEFESNYKKVGGLLFGVVYDVKMNSYLPNEDFTGLDPDEREERANDATTCWNGWLMSACHKQKKVNRLEEELKSYKTPSDETLIWLASALYRRLARFSRVEIPFELKDLNVTDTEVRVAVDVAMHVFDLPTVDSVSTIAGNGKSLKHKYFSYDGNNFELHDSLSKARANAESGIEGFRELLANQGWDIGSDGNFHQISYGIVLGESDHYVDHVVTQEDHDNDEHKRWDVGTELLELSLTTDPLLDHLKNVYPTELTPELKHVLSVMNHNICGLAHLYRQAGYELPPKIEEEQAFFLHRWTKFALEHGSEWAKHANAEVEYIQQELNKKQNERVTNL